MFDQIGSLVNNFSKSKSADENLGIPKVVQPTQNRQLGKALPTQPGSLAGLIQGNKPYVNTNLATTQQPGMIPPKTVGQHIQDKLDTHDMAIANAKKEQKTRTEGDIIGGTSTPDTPTLGPIIGQESSTQLANDTANAKTPLQIAQSTGQPNPVQPPSTPTSTYGAATSGLLNQGNTQDLTYESAIKKAADLQNQESQGVINLGREPMTAGDFMGQSGTLISGLNSEIGNQEALAANALKSKDQQITANTAAGNLTQPQGNTAYFGSPESGGIVGGNTNGGSFPGATGNSLIDTTVQQALNQVAAGGDPTNNPGFDAIKALNSPQAVNAYNEGVTAIKNGSYNPTTSSAVAQSNASQTGAFAQQSKQLGATLSGLKAVGNLADQFLQSTGLNPDTSSFLNAQQNTLLGQLKNPSNIATYNELVNQVQTYANQIYSATGMTPTDAGNLAKSISIDGMTNSSLKAFLNNLDIIGQQRKGILDSQITGSALPNTPSLQTTPNSNQYYSGDNKTVEQGGGALMNFTGDIAAAGGALLKLIGL